MPGNKWEFDSSVTDVFDDMLARSIPQYDVMRHSVFEIAAPFVKDSTHIVDLGCSRGEALQPFIDRFGARNLFLGLEVSDPMIAAARTRYAGMINANLLEVRKHDLRYQPYPPVRSSATLSVLTLQFIPMEYRMGIVRDIFKATVPGGVFVLVEKVIGATAEIDRIMVELYLGMKKTNGYTQEQIDRKRLSLEGVLVPVTAGWNEQFLTSAGFRQVDCFWRWMNFAGWIAVKE